MAKTKLVKNKQSGVIPYLKENGMLKVVLITSRGKNRWIVPKGNIEKNHSSSSSAAKEAFEEAGIKGKIVGEDLGSYRYSKSDSVFEVKIFPFEIKKTLDKWPESKSRLRRIVSLDQAKDLIEDADLKKMLRKIPKIARNS